MFPESNLNYIACGVLASLLLLYPLKTRDVHPIVQFSICASLTAVGLDMGLSALFIDSKTWVMLASFVLALSTVIVPAVGALFGLATAAGLVANAIALNCLPPGWSSVITAAATLGGAAVLVVDKEMFLYWQLVAPPIVGAYLAAECASAFLLNEWYLYGIWIGATVFSVLLHVRRRRFNTWLDRKRTEAVTSKESQIVAVMRSANPDMKGEDFEKLKEKLLGAVEGDREQIDRIVFGGGLY